MRFHFDTLPEHSNQRGAELLSYITIIRYNQPNTSIQMEPLGTGASVLAFVLLCLKSAKVAHEVLSSIKARQTHVDQTRRAVRELESTLQRLSSCRITEERQNGPLLAAVQACVGNMKKFAAKLETLRGAHIPGLGRQRNGIKVFLEDKDLGRMNAVVFGHTTALNFHLRVLERCY